MQQTKIKPIIFLSKIHSHSAARLGTKIFFSWNDRNVGWNLSAAMQDTDTEIFPFLQKERKKCNALR